MRFYELPPAVEDAVRQNSVRPYVRAAFQLSDEFGDFESVFIPDCDILECVINSYRETDGGIVNTGDLIMDNTSDIFNPEYEKRYCTGLGVEIWYCFGNSETTFLRFVLEVDKNGFQMIETGCDERICKIHLVDLSTKLNKENTQRNWTDRETVVHSVVCDKEHPEKSLVHILAKRAGLGARDIDCGYLPFNIPYAEVTGSVWKELSELARAYSANLECGKDKPLSFTESPYDTMNAYSEEPGFTLTEKEITHYRSFSDNSDYSNSIRLKYTHYTELERQELWRYKDSPSWYDENMEVCYPFTDDNREISGNGYEARYTARNSEGKICAVAYAEDLDDRATFEGNIRTVGGDFTVTEYDTASDIDRARIRLDRNGNNIALYDCFIYGKPIIRESNFCVFKRDENEIEKYGLIARNVANKYMSDDKISGIPFYEKRTANFLSESVKLKRSYYLTTRIALIHARVGAFLNVRFTPDGAERKMQIEQVTFRYKQKEAFSTELWLKGNKSRVARVNS